MVFYRWSLESYISWLLGGGIWAKGALNDWHVLVLGLNGATMAVSQVLGKVVVLLRLHLSHCSFVCRLFLVFFTNIEHARISIYFCVQKRFLLFPDLLILLIIFETVGLLQSITWKRPCLFCSWFRSVVNFVIKMDSGSNGVYHLLNLTMRHRFILVDILRNIFGFLFTVSTLPFSRNSSSLKLNSTRWDLRSILMTTMDMAFYTTLILFIFDWSFNKCFSWSKEIMQISRLFYLFIYLNVIMKVHLMMNVMNKFLHVFLLREAYWLLMNLKVIIDHFIYLFVCHLKLSFDLWNWERVNVMAFDSFIMFHLLKNSLVIDYKET